MRILHVAASYLPATRYGGTIVSVHGLCKALAARGHDVHVFTTSVDGPGDSAVPIGVPVAVEGVKVWYFQSRHLRRLYWAPALGRALRERIATFDILHTHAIYLWPLWTAAREAHAHGVPHVLSLRGMLEKDLVEKKNPFLKAALIGFIERPTIERAAAIHVTSAREADEARAFGFAFPPFCEIPNGVDRDAPSRAAVNPRIADTIVQGPYGLFLGRINWKKGLDRLIAALTLAPGVRVVFAGNDEEDYRRVLEAAAISAGVSDRVAFTGEVSGADKAALLQNAQWLVLPSYSENFGNVVLEAMAAGRPVIVTPEVGAAEIVRTNDAGMVVAGDPVSLGGALSDLSADRERRERLGANGRLAASQQFSWDAVAAQMEQLYETVRQRAC